MTNDLMRVFFSILSVAYISGIFLWADSPMVSDLASFNPYSLLHIPLYGILTLLITFSLAPFKLKRNNAINAKNPRNPINSTNPINPINPINLRFFIPGIIVLTIAIADEIHQSFIPTRDASIIDVFLDFIGIVLSTYLVSRLYKIKKWAFGFKLFNDPMTQ